MPGGVELPGGLPDAGVELLRAASRLEATCNCAAPQSPIPLEIAARPREQPDNDRRTCFRHRNVIHAQHPTAFSRRPSPVRACLPHHVLGPERARRLSYLLLHRTYQNGQVFRIVSCRQQHIRGLAETELPILRLGQLSRQTPRRANLLNLPFNAGRHSILSSVVQARVKHLLRTGIRASLPG